MKGAGPEEMVGKCLNSPGAACSVILWSLRRWKCLLNVFSPLTDEGEPAELTERRGSSGGQALISAWKGRSERLNTRTGKHIRNPALGVGDSCANQQQTSGEQ